MSDYKRITKGKIDLSKLSEKARARISDTYIQYAEMNNALCNLEDKIEQGKMIELPCKVGDILFGNERSWTTDTKVVPFQITNFTITQNKKGKWTKKYCAMQIIDGKTSPNRRCFAFEDIGKTIFLTKAEAEQKLKELQNND